MAIDFPPSPTVGQLHPTVPVAGTPQYWWDGTAWLVVAAAGIVGFGAVRIRIIPSGAYVPDPNMLYCIIECVGGGGGGGSAVASASSAFVGGGGGGGGYSRKVATKAVIGASQSVSVGPGGAGGAAGPNNGGDGSATQVGSLCLAWGGGAGRFASVGQAPGGGIGSGIGTGDVVATGSPGSGGFYNGINTTIISLAGGGGSSALGGGGIIPNYIGGVGAVAGANGSNYGGGGSGSIASTSTATAKGGDGAPGVVIVTEYCSQ